MKRGHVIPLVLAAGAAVCVGLSLTGCGGSPRTATAASPASTAIPTATSAPQDAYCVRVKATMATIKRDLAPAESGPSGGSLPAILATVRKDHGAWSASLASDVAGLPPGIAGTVTALGSAWDQVAATGSTPAIIGAARAARNVRAMCP